MSKHNRNPAVRSNQSVRTESSNLSKEISMSEPTMNETVPQTASPADSDQNKAAAVEAEKKGVWDKVTSFFGTVKDKTVALGSAAWKLTLHGFDVVKEVVTTREGFSDFCKYLGKNTVNLIMLAFGIISLNMMIMAFGTFTALLILCGAAAACYLIAAFVSKESIMTQVGLPEEIEVRAAA